MKIEYIVITLSFWLLYSLGYWIGSYFERARWKKITINTNMLFAKLRRLNVHMDDSIKVMDYHKTQMDDLVKEHLELLELAKAVAETQRRKNESS